MGCAIGLLLSVNFHNFLCRKYKLYLFDNKVILLVSGYECPKGPKIGLIIRHSRPLED